MMTALSVLPLPPPTATPPVVIALFGSFNVTINGQAEVAFRSNKARALLAYLLVNHTQPVLRTTLSALLWPDYQAASARVNLRQTLANLRDSLAPYDLLYTDRNHVQLKIDPAIVRCDVVLFSELVDACQRHEHRTIQQCLSCQERLQQALALYQGAFLENFPNVDSPAFHRWRQTQRTHFADCYMEAQTLLAPGRKPHTNLPSPLTPLIGRTQEIAELGPRLRHTVYRCVSLVGPGGIGKTRLACAIAEQVQPAFPDGIWLVALGALAPTTTAETPAQLHDRMATAIAMTIGCTLSGATHPTAQLINYLADKTALLILDSFEHLTVGAAWLPTVLAAAPHLRLLVTTRHRLPLQSQLVYPVGGLGVPPEGPTTGVAAAHLMAQYASVQLFVERAESGQMMLALDASTLAMINRFCRFVEGSPWAIEVAVSMLDQHTPSTLLSAIQQNYRTLRTPLLDLPARQRSAEAVFLTAWALLSPPEAQILARCAVFRRGFTLDAAQTVAAATPAILETLVYKSLLQHRGAERYTMHDLVRQFAGEQLALDVATADRTYAAHAAYFTGLLATWQPDDATEQRFRTAVTQDWENVQAAWDWAVTTGQVALLQQGVAGLAEFYEMTGLFLESERTFERTLAQVRLWQAANPVNDAPADRAAGAVQTLLAHLLWRRSYMLVAALGQVDEAQRLAEELVGWGERLADEMLVAWGYCELSLVALLQGDYQRQQALLLQALPYAQQRDDQYALVSYLNLLGISCKMQYDYAAAQPYFEAALTLAQAMYSSRRELRVLQNLGSFHLQADNFTAAHTYLQQTLTRAQQVVQKDSVMFANTGLGALAYTMGDYTGARTYWEVAYQGYIELGDQVLEAQVLTMFAALHAEVGEVALAGAYCQRALASPAAQTYIVQREALMIQGQLQRAAGNWAAARATYAAAYTLSQQTNLVAEWLPVQAHLAALDLAQGETSAALAAVEPVLANFAASQLNAAKRPQELLWLVYQILVANHDLRAPLVLHQAWALVQAQLARINDPRLYETFLTNVPVNRALRQLLDNQNNS